MGTAVIVVDTNVIAYLFIGGDYTASAEKVREADPTWLAPMLWRSEICNVLMLYLRRQILTLNDAKLYLSNAEKMLAGHEHEVNGSRVLELAHGSNCTAYDCEFVSIAEKFNLPLVTSDKKLLATFPDIAVSMNAFVA